MKINDKLANGLYLGVSTRPGGGVGLFTGTDIAAGAPICEYKGDVYGGDDGYKDLSIRYNYTVQQGLEKPLLVYSAKHRPSNSWIDCHPALCKTEMGLGGFINDAKSYAGRLVFKEDIIVSDTFKQRGFHFRYPINNISRIRLRPSWPL